MKSTPFYDTIWKEWVLHDCGYKTYRIVKEIEGGTREFDICFLCHKILLVVDIASVAETVQALA